MPSWSVLQSVKTACSCQTRPGVLTLVLAAAGSVVVNSTRVEDERVWSSVHRDCQGPFGEQGFLKGIFTSISCDKVALQPATLMYACFVCYSPCIGKLILYPFARWLASSEYAQLTHLLLRILKYGRASDAQLRHKTLRLFCKLNDKTETGLGNIYNDSGAAGRAWRGGG